MSEATSTYCDYCNGGQSSTQRKGRGYLEFSTEKDAIRFVEWGKRSKGIMCTDCQDEEETEASHDS